MGSAVIQLAYKISKRHEATYADYLSMRDEDLNRGYTPRHCEHGKSRWTAYDNICGPCEDGFTMGDPMTRRTVALNEARDRVEKINALAEHAFQLRKLVPGINVDSIIDEIRRLGEI